MSDKGVWDGTRWIGMTEARQMFGPDIVAGSVWNGQQWVPPAPKKSSGSKVVLLVLLVLAAIVVASCLVQSATRPQPAPVPCPTRSADDLGDAFSNGFEQGLSGCQ